MKVTAIVGPTASGKTSAGVALAERLDAEILSCDSVAVYRGLDIGAAKPTAEERARVRHHLIDIVDPGERFSAARWAELADEAARDIAARGKAVLVVGGTGLYLRAWLHGLVPTPPPDPEIRARHRAMDLAALAAELAKVDPEAAARIAPTDRVRLSRALEVWEQTGVPLSELQRRHAGPPRYEARLVGIDPPRAELHARIDARVDQMMERGLLEEVRALEKRFGDAAPALRSLGYSQLLAYLRDEVGLEEAVRQIKRDSRRFARRQRTWFRSETSILWYPSAAALLEHTHGDRDG